MIKVYGLKVSYFTGKLEGYLRYKDIPYEFCPLKGSEFQKKLPKNTGAMQMPAVQLDDGRWMTDTSPMIDWFEGTHTQYPILPDDPVQQFVCRLIEDYADEWLWRPAMHYRWSYPACAKLLRRQIVEDMARDLRLPKWLTRWRVERRQFYNFVRKDGVDDQTRAHVEGSYTSLLKMLAAIFEKRPFIFGEAPTLADIGLFGPLFRHFSMDPVPAAIMRETAPAVMAWVYRLWNTKASGVKRSFVDGVADDLLPLIKEINETHIENLNANALAWKNGDRLYDVQIQSAHYRNVPMSRYRVWCLEKLQEQARESAVADAPALQNCFEKLKAVENPDSRYDTEGALPFARAIPVYEKIRG